MKLNLSDQSAASLTVECERIFDLCYPRDDVTEHDWVVNRRVDFSLWIDIVGAGASGRASLDARLESRPREAALTKSMLSRFLDYLDRLKNATSDSAFRDAKRDVDSAIENLTILAVAIRSTGRVPRFRKADARLNRAAFHDFEQYLRFMILISPFSEDELKDPKLKQQHKDQPLWWEEVMNGQLSAIQQRLVEANILRRNRFLYAQRHSTKLSVRSRSQSRLVNQQGKDGELSVRQQRNVTEVKETMTDPHCLTTKGPLENKRKMAPSLSATSATALEQSIVIAQFQRKQKVPVTKTRITTIAGTMEYPKLFNPKQAPSPVSQLMAEKCPCCCEPLPEAVFQGHKEWEYAHLPTYTPGTLRLQVNRKHLVQDVQPYTCFAEDCPIPAVLYATSRDLETHLQEQHNNGQICQLCDNSQARLFEELEELIQHVQEQHKDTFPQELHDSIELWPTTQRYGLNSCPLCHSSGSDDDPIFIEHVLKHIHWFSLLSLPWPDSQIQICKDFVPEYTDHASMQKWLGELEQPTQAQLDRMQAVMVASGISHINAELPVSLGYFSNNKYFADSTNNRGSRPATPDTMLGEEHSDSSRDSNRPKFIVPYPRSLAFKEDHISSQLRRFKLSGAKSGSGQKQSTACLHGPSDITNTYTVSEFAYAMHDSYPAMNIFWLRGDSMDAFFRSISSIALKCNILGAAADLGTDALSLMRAWLEDESHGRWVAIIDSCNESLIEPMVERLPECGHGAILFTTKKSFQLNRPNSHHETIYVEPMQPRRIAELLRNSLWTQPSDEKTLQSVSVQLSQDHLRLSFILAFIRTYRLTADDFFLLIGDPQSLSSDLFINGMTFLLNDVHICEPLEKTWSNSLARIHQSRTAACNLLSLLSVFSSKPIPYTLLHAYMRREYPLDRADFNNDLGFLELNGLLSVTQTPSAGLVLNSIVQWAIRKWLAAEGRFDETTKEAIITTLEVFPSAQGSSAQEGIYNRLVPHAVAILDHRGAQSGLGPMPQQASLLLSLAVCLFEEGDLNNAARYCQEAMDMNEYIWGREDPSTIHIATRLAKIRESQEQLRQSMESRAQRQPRTRREPTKEVRISRKSLDKRIHLPVDDSGSIFDQIKQQETRPQSEHTPRSLKGWSEWIYDDTYCKYYRYRKNSKGYYEYDWAPESTVGQSSEPTEWIQFQERGDTKLECSDAEIQDDSAGLSARADYLENDFAISSSSHDANELASSITDKGKGKGIYDAYSETDYHWGDSGNPDKMQYSSVGARYSDQVEDSPDLLSTTRNEHLPNLFSGYRVEHSKKFQPGQIFRVHWVQLLGESEANVVSGRSTTGTSTDRWYSPFGDHFSFGFRRFVVIANDDGHCQCVPILTYGGKACTKRGTLAANHGVIFDDKRPQLLKGEPQMGFRPVKAHMFEDGERLTNACRVNYSAISTIEHSWRVLFIGRIASDDDLEIFSEAVNICWERKTHLRKQ
ncbi:hypothetical protein S40288_01818 [Stachybotrys chartarum IBT 40288]|nr:hypothetical protein S40288_01818 [Stachybotrys chartarum IBT 40288]